jgi:aminoglycoside/choline kinase family phosphotransferase
MEKEGIILSLRKLYQQYSDKSILTLTALPLSGSERKYFRIVNSDNKSFIAVYNLNKFENNAFFSFTASFRKGKIKVPEILSIDSDQNIYLIEDLGDHNLLSILEEEKNKNSDFFNAEIEQLYKQAINDLIDIQLECDKIIDYQQCYPTAVFDKKSMLADCHLFKYWFLFPTQTGFNEIELENDFETFSQALHYPAENYFMFRDFQGRNIMVKGKELYYIDYQGGRKGPLQYDLASLLYQAKASIPAVKREQLLDYYIKCISKKIKVDEIQFKERYYGIVLLRTLQVLGAYGFKGYFQQKKHFLDSIPFAIENLKYLLTNKKISYKLPELTKVLTEIVQNYQNVSLTKTNIFSETKSLTVHIRSFAYKNGLPEDESEGHGQGYVFDCRIIHNPGRYEEFKKLNGKDKAVQDFFEKDGEMKVFLEPISNIIEMAINRYLERDFKYLGINFGCTGGQHRSVFAAERMQTLLQKKYGQKINIVIQHREENNW